MAQPFQNKVSSLSLKAQESFTGDQKSRGSHVSFVFERADYSKIICKSRHKSQVYKMLAVTGFPFLILIIQNIITLVNDQGYLKESNEVRSNLEVSMEIGTVVHFLQIERGTTAMYVASNGNAQLFYQVQKAQENTDVALTDMTVWPTAAVFHPDQFSSVESLKIYLSFHRRNLDAARTTYDEELRFYNAVVETMLKWVVGSFYDKLPSAVLQRMFAFHLSILSKEAAGIERALGSVFFAQGLFRFTFTFLIFLKP